MQTLDDEISNNHDNIVKVATSVGGLYEYTHQSFRNMSENLGHFRCQLNNELLEISFALQRDRMMIKLYIDLVGSIVSIFNNYPTPLLLLICTFIELIKQNKEFFDNTIEHEYMFIITILFFLCCQCIRRR